MPDWRAIAAELRAQGVAMGASGEARDPTPVPGGDINAAWRLDAADETLFLKTADANAVAMFEAEAEGLAELASANVVRVPAVRACGAVGQDAFIALEWIDISAPGNETEALFGEQLAALHGHTAECFGWHRDNTIGLTPQRNTVSGDWPAFFREQRLNFQLALAASKGFAGELQAEGRLLAANLDALFAGYTPVPSLLHGDLWGGNWGAAVGQPVMFDPAVYYGDRESDLAMTRLFGGFGRHFYDAYEAAWPMANGHEARLALYQLYHVLNHLNLFGGGYRERALQLMRGLNRMF